jgi:hypothetical protein
MRGTRPTPAAVATLLEDVYSACAAYWTWLAYWAAQLRGNRVLVDARIQNLYLWKRYVGPSWTGLMDILDEVPIEDSAFPKGSFARPRRVLRASGYRSRCGRSAFAMW